MNGYTNMIEKMREDAARALKEMDNDLEFSAVDAEMSHISMSLEDYCKKLLRDMGLLKRKEVIYE